MNRWKYLNLWKYMNSPLLIENYSQGPSQGKLIFNIISFPHRSPKRQLILFALKSMEQLPELGFQGGAEPAGHLSCCTSTPSPHPKSFGTSRVGLNWQSHARSGFFCSESLSQSSVGAAGAMCSPRGSLWSCVFQAFNPPLREDVFLHQGCQERLSPGRSNVSSTRRCFSFLFQMHRFFICLIPRRSCGTSFTFRGCLGSWNNSELRMFSWSWAGPASSMSPASAEDRRNVASRSLLGQLGA